MHLVFARPRNCAINREAKINVPAFKEFAI